MSKSYPELMDQTIRDTINQKKGSHLMKINEKESNIEYKTTEEALEALKKGDFYNSLGSINKEIFNKKILEAKKEVRKNEEKNKKNKKKKKKKREKMKKKKEAEKLALQKKDDELTNIFKDVLASSDSDSDDEILLKPLKLDNNPPPGFSKRMITPKQHYAVSAMFQPPKASELPKPSIGGRKTRRRRKKKGKRKTKRRRKTKKKKFRKKRRTRQKR